MPTKIEWVFNPDDVTRGETWNPITGCVNTCYYCYARILAHTRMKEVYLIDYENAILAPPELTGKLPSYAVPDPFYPRYWPERIERHVEQSKSSKKGKGYFVVDMGDLFGKGILDEWIKQVLFTAWSFPKNRYYLLTKKSERLPDFSPFPDNCWVGVTTENQEQLIDALMYLEKVKAKVKYLSIEPLHEQLNGGECEGKRLDGLKQAGINWVIIGAETSYGKPVATNLPKIEWVKEIVAAADKAGAAVFL
jgi:protein gp37